MASEDLEKQIFDIVVSTNKESNLDINYRFVYNTYSVDERTIDDNIIFDSGSQKRNRYIELISSGSINALPTGTNPDGTYTYGSFYDDYEATLEETGGITNGYTFIKGDLINISKSDTNRNLFEIETGFFNNICDYDTEKSFFYNETKSDDLNLMNFYNLEEADINNFSFVQNNSKSFVSREEIRNVVENESNHFLPSENELSILQNYDLIMTNQNIDTKPTKQLFNGNMFFNYNNFRSYFHNDITSIKNSDSLNITKAGFLVTKYIKVEDDDYEKKSDVFMLAGEGHTYEFNLRDDNVIYGNTYLYRIQEVYIYRRASADAIFYSLVCGYPFFTEDIVCEETKNPEPPVALTAEYDLSTKSLTLNWETPTNDQNDAKGYQVLKRKSLEEPFVVVSQIESHFEFEVFERKEDVLEEVIVKSPGIMVNSYVDKNFDRNNIQIYTVRTLDAHGNLSLYSSQIAVMYNIIENKLKVDLLSKPGAPINMPNLLIPRRTMLFENENFSVTNLPIASDVEKVTLYVTPDFVNISNNETPNNTFNIMGEKYKFTMTKLNTLSKYEKEIKIKNFSQRVLT